MKRNRILAKIGVTALLFAPNFALGISGGQVDDFQSGTTEGWSNGAGGSNVANIASGGPAGQSDRYLQLSSGSFGGSPRLIMFNDAQWQGDYIAADVVGVNVQLQNLGPDAIPIRIAIREGSSGSFTPGYASTNSFSLPADGQWHSAFFSLTADSLTGINSPQPVATDLSNVADFRLLSSTVPATIGDIVSAQLGIDDITAIPLGDVNLDGTRNIADIQAMLTALADVNSYASSHQLDSAGLLAIDDLNGDGAFTNADVQALINLLATSGSGTFAAVPEPASAVLLLIGFAAGIQIYRATRRIPKDSVTIRPPIAARRDYR